MATLFRICSICSFFLFSIYWIASNSGYRWQWFRVPKYFIIIDEGRWFSGPLLEGLWITIKLSFYSLIITLIIGYSCYFLEISSSYLCSMFVKVYQEVVRNTPLLVQLYLFYLVFRHQFNLSGYIDAFTSGVLVLAVYEGAFASNIIKLGINGIAKHQFESARALGMSRFIILWKIITPQAILIMLPPMTNIAVNLLKNSSIVSVIAVSDLTNQGRNIIADTFMTFEIWFSVALIYILLSLFLSSSSRYFEKKLNWEKRISKSN